VIDREDLVEPARRRRSDLGRAPDVGREVRERVPHVLRQAVERRQRAQPGGLEQAQRLDAEDPAEPCARRAGLDLDPHADALAQDVARDQQPTGDRDRRPPVLRGVRLVVLDHGREPVGDVERPAGQREPDIASGELGAQLALGGRCLAGIPGVVAVRHAPSLTEPGPRATAGARGMPGRARACQDHA
jgi:hypothetical protein